MADRKTIVGTNGIEGETRFGPNDPNQKTAQGILYVSSSNVASKGSILALDAVSALGVCTTIYLWASTDGKWRTGTAVPADTEAGTVVGSQS